MYAKILLIVLNLSITFIDSYYLQAESNFLKPKLERNNIVNKGIWVRNKMESFIDKSSLNDFIFRPNSLDVDNNMQNNFDFFGHNTPQDSPYVSAYVQRTRRSPEHIRIRRPRKSMKTGKVIRSSIEDSVMIKSKLVSDLKPTSVFNEYPYEVAILLNDETDKAIANSKKAFEEKIHEIKLENDIPLAHIDMPVTDSESHITQEELKIISLNSSDISSEVPKRSKKNDHNDEPGRNVHISQDNNKTEKINKYNNERDIFKEKDVRSWVQNIPAPDNTFYKVVPKEPEKLKPVTERGLIKVISMLTKTFKKIMKQHSEIKDIHDKLLIINKHFDEKIAEIATKFEDFDSKYSDMIQFNNKLKDFENEIRSQKEYFENKQKEIQSSFTEFQGQQKTFLAQQRQFYSIQKLMLAQNEKINEKQNLITQTQSQISLRQNNFARILKKAKQIINESKAKLNTSFVKQQDKYVANVDTTVIPISTTATPYTESMKINLFSIPIKNKLENKDALIIKEKDEKQIDDLVYKYYFNNTFIDSLMKNKILNNFASNTNSAEIVNRSKLSKNKRDELETTLMLPVNNSLSDTPMKRERRWINHFSKNRYRRLNRHKKNSTNNDATNVQNNNLLENKNALNEVKSADDPFSTMAKSFCNEIGQNENDQALKWCMEKALRRLNYMGSNSFTPPPLTVMVKQEPKITVAPSVTNKVKRGDEQSTQNSERVNNTETVHSLEYLKSNPEAVTNQMGVQTTTLEPVSRVTPLFIVSNPTQAVFFPDNDELESNLKEFDMKPDTEGNVYYDGSVHISDYAHLAAESDGATSDIMPGLMDSNSRVEIDPVTFDIQAKRRAYVRRFNENVMKQIRQV